MKKLALMFAALVVLSFAACGQRGPVSSSSSAVAPPAGTSSAAPEIVPPRPPESAAGEEKPPLLLCDEGVQVKKLMTWEPGQQQVEIPFPIWEDWLLLEVRKGGKVRLVGYDLSTGEEGYLGLLPEEPTRWHYEYRRVTDAPGWEVKILSETAYRRDSWTHRIGDYHLPEALQEGRRRYRSGWDWDAQPEKDLLTWTDPEGLWLAKADGGDARLLLAAEAAGPYLEQWGMTGEDGWQALLERDWDSWESLGILSPRLMNGGQTIAADFGVPGNQWGHNGLVVVDIATGKTDWYNHYIAMTADGHEYLDDTHILMGTTRIDVTTGETTPAWRWTLTDHLSLWTGDFVHYFGSEEQEDGSIDLLTCTLKDGDIVEDWAAVKPFLTASGYRYFYPFANSAVDARRVICHYATAEEEGLAMVTLPE